MAEVFAQSATWGALFLIFAGLVTALYARGLVARSTRLRAEGVDTQAAVERLETRVHSIYFRTGISFNVPVCHALVTDRDPVGRTRRVEVEVSRPVFDRLSVDQSIPVRYLPASPGVMEVEPRRHALDARMVWSLAVVFFGCACLLALSVIEWGPR